VKQQRATHRKVSFCATLRHSAFIWTKKVHWQAENADFRQIFRDPEYMIGNLWTEIGGSWPLLASNFWLPSDSGLLPFTGHVDVLCAMLVGGTNALNSASWREVSVKVGPALDDSNALKLYYLENEKTIR
jgi:hypothetical protein